MASINRNALLVSFKVKAFQLITWNQDRCPLDVVHNKLKTYWIYKETVSHYFPLLEISNSTAIKQGWLKLM